MGGAQGLEFPRLRPQSAAVPDPSGETQQRSHGGPDYRGHQDDDDERCFHRPDSEPEGHRSGILDRENRHKDCQEKGKNKSRLSH